MAVQWHPWGPEAFAAAKEAKKPLLLSIGATWCHWCHVQQRTVFADPAIAARINELFVPVRVDTDQRPDINERYNQGGWPTTAILNHEGGIVTAGTYIPPEQFSELLDQVAVLYPQLGGGELAHIPEPVPGALSPGIVSWVLEKLQLSFDSSFGGWGTGQKFPMAEALELLASRGDPALLQLALKSADGACRLLDQEAGGFFRYAVQRDWSEPHYEKMLETNALLLSALSALVPHAPALRPVIERTVGYLTTALARPGGGFWGSQDADEDYYKLPAAERAKRSPPSVDRTAYSAENGLALRGLVAAWEATKSERCKTAALSTAAFLLSCWRAGEGFCRSWEDVPDSTGAQTHGPAPGAPSTFGLLLDNVEAAHGLLVAGRAFEQPAWVAAARAAADLILERFQDPLGGFRDRVHRADDQGLLAQPLLPFIGNARAARFLLALNEERYREAAKRALERFAGSYLRYGILAAEYARAVDELLAPR